MKIKKVSILLAIIIFSFFALGCANIKIDGRYIAKRSLLGGASFNFNDSNKEFEYYSYGEWGIQAYSKGTYAIKKNKIYLLGYTDANIKHIDYRSSVIDDSMNHSKIKVCISYRMYQGNNMIQTILLVDNEKHINLNKDTTLFFHTMPRDLQVISYMSYDGLLSNPPPIDTLKTSRIIMSNRGRFNTINLSFIINGNDFSRVAMNDTLKIKKQNLLLKSVSNKKVKFQKQK